MRWPIFKANKKMKHQHLGSDWIDSRGVRPILIYPARARPAGDIDKRENRTRGGDDDGEGLMQRRRRCSGESAVKPNKCHQWKSVFINV